MVGNCLRERKSSRIEKKCRKNEDRRKKKNKQGRSLTSSTLLRSWSTSVPMKDLDPARPTRLALVVRCEDLFQDAPVLQTAIVRGVNFYFSDLKSETCMFYLKRSLGVPSAREMVNQRGLGKAGKVK